MLFRSNNAPITELKTAILHISNKYSKLRKRDTPKFSPFFCFYGIDDSNLIELKKQLSRDKVVFTDGYNFRGADFDAASIVKKPSNERPILLRIIDSIDFLKGVYRLCDSTIEIYQFYKTRSLYENSDHKHIKIPFEELNDIFSMKTENDIANRFLTCISRPLKGCLSKQENENKINSNSSYKVVAQLGRYIVTKMSNPISLTN